MTVRVREAKTRRWGRERGKDHEGRIMRDGSFDDEPFDEPFDAPRGGAAPQSERAY